MLDPKTTLLVALAFVAVGFALFWGRALRASARSESLRPTPYEILVGFVTDFFDTLGIGSFATTTSLYRARRTIDDRLLPGTLNVGHTIPTFVQAFIYTKSVEVGSRTLIALIAASVAGALLGAPIVARWPRRQIQIGMGCALLVLTGVLVYRQLWTQPTTGTIELSGGLFAAGIAGNFVLGALMTIGVGLYAPCLVMVSMLGMNPGTGFPIMMGSCAFLMPVASVPFVRQQCYAPRAALGLTLAGVPAVLVAHWWFESLDINTVKWLVAVVVVYTAVTLLRAAARERSATPTEARKEGSDRRLAARDVREQFPDAQRSEPSPSAKHEQGAASARRHDVFLSFASSDQLVCDELLAALEARGIGCWVARRDIPPGAVYADAIPNAIRGARALVVVVSAAANRSPHVHREVELADGQHLPIIPFRIENVRPAGALEYFLSSQQWLDAFALPLESHFLKLADRLAAVLATPEERPR